MFHHPFNQIHASCFFKGNRHKTWEDFNNLMLFCLRRHVVIIHCKRISQDDRKRLCSSRWVWKKLQVFHLFNFISVFFLCIFFHLFKKHQEGNEHTHAHTHAHSILTADRTDRVHVNCQSSFNFLFTSADDITDLLPVWPLIFTLIHLKTVQIFHPRQNICVSVVMTTATVDPSIGTTIPTMLWVF